VQQLGFSKAVNGICFLYYLLESIGMNIKVPIVVSCDNVGAVFMARESIGMNVKLPIGVRCSNFGMLTPDIILFKNMLKLVAFKL
jgi:hypothetical protein